MLKQYTLNEEMTKMKHLMLFEAGQPQQQAADPMASYTTTMQNWGTSLANAQSQYPNSARAIQVALSAASQANPRMLDQAIRMASDPNVKKMIQDYKSAYGTYAKAYQKYNGSKLQSGVNFQTNTQGQTTGYTYNQNNPLVNAGATQDFNQRLSTQIDAAGAQDEQAWENLQTAKDAYSASIDNNVANAQAAQNNYYSGNSFTMPGHVYDGGKVTTQNVAVRYDPQRQGYYYISDPSNNTKTWLTNDQVKNLSGNQSYTDYTNGAKVAYTNSYNASLNSPEGQALQQNYDNALRNYNSASTNYTNALSTPRVNTWSPQAYSQQQTNGQPQQPQQQQPQPQQQQPQPQQQQPQPQQRQQRYQYRDPYDVAGRRTRGTYG